MNMSHTLLYNLSNINEFIELINNEKMKDSEPSCCDESCSDVTNNLNKSKVLKLNRIISRSPNSNGQLYKVITYDKTFLYVDTIPTYGLFRSVILNSDNKVICFAPPKSLPPDSFILANPEKSEDLVAEEFVEGTMINVFWNQNIGVAGDWEISTRNTVGASSSFYKSDNSKTFRSMFLEAMNENNLMFESLNPCYCYSFVLQHPENRIVVPFKKPQLYLVGLYCIDNVFQNNIYVYSVDINSVKKMDWGPCTIKFPEVYEWSNYKDLIDKYASMNTSYDILGVVIHNKKTGERTKIRNPVYEQVRNLKGNQPKLQYQYLCLRKEGKVSDFIKYYPEHKNELSSFRDQLHLFTNTIFTNYISCYIKKEKPLLEFCEQYRTHMYNIHQLYLNELREKKLFVTNRIVIEYVNKLHPSLLMYSLNFQMRKKKNDFYNADTTL